MQMIRRDEINIARAQTEVSGGGDLKTLLEPTREKYLFTSDPMDSPGKLW
jgi:hypothetical protein